MSTTSIVSVSQAITIREARESDAQAMSDYANALFSEGLETLFLRDADMTVEKEQAFIKRVKDAQRDVILIAAMDQQLVGLLTFAAHPRPQMAHGGEFGVSVAKAYRGKGIGQKLILALLEWAQGKHFRRIELRVFANNRAGIPLYTSLGFETEGRQRGAVQIAGRYVDLISMVKFI